MMEKRCQFVNNSDVAFAGEDLRRAADRAEHREGVGVRGGQQRVPEEAAALHRNDSAVVGSAHLQDGLRRHAAFAAVPGRLWTGPAVSARLPLP